MVLSVKNFQGTPIGGRDGEVGRVDGIYFDSDDWTIRYLIVDTGGWLVGRKVLVSTAEIDDDRWNEAHVLEVDLTKEQVRNSPPFDPDQPISRSFETGYHDYFSWPYYWGRLDAPAITPEVETRLRPSSEVIGYDIRATDGEIGYAEDLLFDETAWEVRYVVVDTRKWLPGKRVLVASDWVNDINWAERAVDVQLTRDAIRNSPEYSSDLETDRAYEERLYRYYGFTPYWERRERGRRSMG